MNAKMLADAERERAKKRRTSRGSTNNRKRLEAFKGRGGGGSAEWATCDPKLLLAVVSRITDMGGAITFNLSRDRGAHGLTLLLDDERQALWFNGDADLTAELENVLGVLESEEIDS